MFTVLSLTNEPDLTLHSHWAVFIASIATVFVFWGITPTQSGIFATDTLNKTLVMDSFQSTSLLSLSQQGETFSAKSAQSVASIMWLNETLPPFMTKEYILAPFGPSVDFNVTARNGNWTASTLKYSVDVTCEAPISYLRYGRPMVNSSWGCSFRLPLPTLTTNNNATKIFASVYAGYFNEDGLADYYLSGYCPKNESNSFLVQWSKALKTFAFNDTRASNFTSTEQLQNFDVTTLYCRSSYYAQHVEATVRLPNNEVIELRPLGQPQILPSDVFNTSNFEASMNMGHERFRVRTDFPTTDWPSQTGFLTDLPLDLRQLSTMASFAIGASQLPLEDYLDPKTLAGSYQSAYRLLFSRQMVDVLSRNLDVKAQSTGQWSYQTQSVTLVPAFTYTVEALLLASVLFAAILYYNSRMRVSKLHSDPATIACVMSLAADDSALLSKLKLMDQASEKELEFSLRNRRFRLCPITNSNHSCRLQLLDMRGNEPLEAFNDELQATRRQKTMQASRASDEGMAGIVRGLQPTEFKTKMGLAFLATQICLFAAIAALYVKIQKENGLPLPSSNQFVRQLLENYLPTAIGTFIEPFWVVLNRHLCFLQPFDEMRQGRKTANKSLNLEYSSLPPQLTIVKAWSKGNILLGVVCTMALLANGLAISLSGLFFENSVELGTSASFALTYSHRFGSLNGSAVPFTSENKQALESVYIATSNRTANTPLPSWTDQRMFYFPFETGPGPTNETHNYRARTPAIGAQLRCQSLTPASFFNITGAMKETVEPYPMYSILPSMNLVASLTDSEGNEIFCAPRDGSKITTFGQPTGPSALEFAYALDGLANSSAGDSSFCREHLTIGWVRAPLVNGVLPANESALNFPVPTIINDHTETIITCRSILMAGSADVLVSADGHIQKVYSTNVSTTEVPNLLSTAPSDILGQVHQIILEKVDGISWHNDSFPSDFLNYLMEQATNSAAHLDPKKPPPTSESMIPPFAALYSQLFATLVGSNMDQLLIPASKNATLEGSAVKPTIRIFMSKPMFILAETILSLYIIVTVLVYLRRPWRILCRMPTSLGSVIAFLAASHAVKDFRGTAGLSQDKLREHVNKLDDRYGFGTFVGTDGKAHVGIEKYPFLAPLTKEINLNRQGSDDSKRSMRDEWRSKFTQWKSGTVREGGWM